MRIVSLLPSTTEIVAALGCVDQLVGVSHECDEPARARDLPRLTSTPIDPSASSRAIDDAVKSHVEQGLTLYDLDLDALVELQPDVILTQDACAVCAIDLAQVEAALAEVLPDATLVSVAPKTLDEVAQQFETIGNAIGVPERGKAEAAAFRAAIDDWNQRLPPRSSENPPTVYCIEWLDPLMVAGHWVPELVAKAGARYPWLKPGARSAYVTFDDLHDADPDTIVVSPCGMDMITTYDELDAIAGREEWQGLRAVSEDRVFVVDGNAYMNRSGPRIVDTLGILVQHLWPEVDSPAENDRRAQEMLELETKRSPFES
jgi:iron complex transport system substrate-binding protein